MTLSEHLSIYLRLAYTEDAITRVTQPDFESHGNVMESNSGSYTYFKD